MKTLQRLSPSILRIGMSLLFLWFGVNQITNPPDWFGFIPQSILNLTGLSAATIVFWNAIFEIIAGSMLLLGLWTRFISFLLFLHLVDIALMVGLDAIGVRDLGLSVATLAVFLNGADWLTLDHYTATLVSHPSRSIRR